MLNRLEGCYVILYFINKRKVELMKVLIVYSSLTGNTKKLATGVYDALKDDYEVSLANVKEKPSTEDFDIIMPAFWVDRGGADKQSQKFIKALRNKKIIYLGTLGAQPESEHGQKVCKNVPELLDSSNTHLGTFLANGLVDPKMIARIKFIPLPKTIKDKMYQSSITSRATNDTDVENCVAYVKNILGVGE